MTQVSEPRCVFTEGSMTLPAGYREQTVNMLTSPSGPSLNLSRDRLQPGEDFTAWLDRQRVMLKKGLSGYHALDEQPAALGDNLFHGVTLLYRFQPQQDQTLYQRQAVFPVTASDMLIFTLTCAHALTGQDEALFSACLSSYRRP